MSSEITDNFFVFLVVNLVEFILVSDMEKVLNTGTNVSVFIARGLRPHEESMTEHGTTTDAQRTWR